MNFDSNSGKEVADALDKRITSIAKQVWNKNPSCRWVQGIVISTLNGKYTIKINNATYTNVKAYSHISTINVGDVVDLLIPNNNWSLIRIIGILS